MKPKAVYIQDREFHSYNSDIQLITKSGVHSDIEFVRVTDWEGVHEMPLYHVNRIVYEA